MPKEPEKQGAKRDTEVEEVDIYVLITNQSFQFNRTRVINQKETSVMEMQPGKAEKTKKIPLHSSSGADAYESRRPQATRPEEERKDSSDTSKYQSKGDDQKSE